MNLHSKPAADVWRVLSTFQALTCWDGYTLCTATCLQNPSAPSRLWSILKVQQAGLFLQMYRHQPSCSSNASMHIAGATTATYSLHKTPNSASHNRLCFDSSATVQKYSHTEDAYELSICLCAGDQLHTVLQNNKETPCMQCMAWKVTCHPSYPSPQQYGRQWGSPVQLRWEPAAAGIAGWPGSPEPLQSWGGESPPHHHHPPCHHADLVWYSIIHVTSRVVPC